MSVQTLLFDPNRSTGAKVAQNEEGMAAGFDVSRLVKNFEALAESDGGVASLRQLALQFAFQGRFTGNGRRLVPARVRGTPVEISPSTGRDATSLIVSGGAALAVGPAEMLIPEGWDWVPLVSVARLESGHTPSRSHPDYWDGGIPWIGIRDAKAHNYGWIDSTEQTVSEKGLANSSARLLPAGTVCLSRTASVGYVTLMKRPMSTSQDFVNWVCGERLLPEFLMQLLRCEVPVLRRFSKGAVHQTIYFPEVKAFHISLPPVAEQKRIVAKVDQLMALCDELEARQTKKHETGTRLTKSALDALTTAEGPAEFDAAWKRVAENFNVLIDRADKVRDLRKSILSLAVRGRLTRPVAGPTPVEQLLRSIDDKRTALAKLRKASRPDALAPVSVREEPFSIPPSWRWVRFGVATVCRDGQRIPVSKEDRANRKGSYDYYGASGVIDSIDDFIFDETLLLVGEDGANLLNRSTPIAFLASGKYWVNNHAHVLDSADELMLRYLALFINATDLSPYVTGTAQPKMNQAKMNLIPIALPPREDQREVVEKVDQLMKICDDLEAHLRRVEDRAAKLVEAAVQELVA